jgi:MFS family permease
VTRSPCPTPLSFRCRSSTTPSRAFWLYWVASAISLTGDAISAIALPLTAITVLHATSFEVSVLTAATYVAWVVIGLPAGAVVHRRPLRRTQVAADLVRAAALASVPIAAWSDALSVAQLVGVALVVSFASVLFDVANSTFIASVVPREDLTRRNSLTSATVAVTQTGGPSLGGLLVHLVGAAGAVIFDVGSFLASALLLSRLPAGAPATDAEPPPVRSVIRDGWRFVAGHPIVRAGTAMATAGNFVCGALLALGPLFLVRTLHVAVGLVGLLIATEGVGTLLGAAITPRLAVRVGSARLLLRAAVIGSLFALLLPLAGHGAGVLLFALGNAGFAGGIVVLSVLNRTHRQEASPAELLPQVVATVRFVSWGVVPVGALLAGGLAEAIGIRTTLAAFCVFSFAVPAIAWSSAMRGRRDLND